MDGVRRISPLGDEPRSLSAEVTVCHEPIGTVKSDKVTEPLGATGFTAAGSTFRHAGFAAADRCCEILFAPAPCYQQLSEKVRHAQILSGLLPSSP
jgi:hypothetical protein